MFQFITAFSLAVFLSRASFAQGPANNYVSEDSVQHLSCGENTRPGVTKIKILKVCRTVLVKGVSEYDQDNYITFYYSDDLALSVPITARVNVNQDNNLPQGIRWALILQMDHSLDPQFTVVRNLGFWHGAKGERWWGRGLTSIIRSEDVNTKNLDPRVGILSGDDPRGISFSAPLVSADP